MEDKRYVVDVIFEKLKTAKKYSYLISKQTIFEGLWKNELARAVWDSGLCITCHIRNEYGWSYNDKQVWIVNMIEVDEKSPEAYNGLKTIKEISCVELDSRPDSMKLTLEEKKIWCEIWDKDSWDEFFYEKEYYDKAIELWAPSNDTENSNCYEKAIEGLWVPPGDTGTYNCYSNTTDSVNTLTGALRTMTERLKDTNVKFEYKKENKMNNFFKNIPCGKVENIKMSMYGPAFKNEKGNWVSVVGDTFAASESDEGIVYSDNFHIEIVDDLTFDVPFFVLPVAPNDVKEGDYILVNGHYGKVNGVYDNSIGILDIYTSKYEDVEVPGFFGMRFVGKVINPFEGMMNGVDTQSGFNPMMFMLMKDGDNSDLLPLMMMSGAFGNVQGGGSMGQMNPWMMMALMK